MGGLVLVENPFQRVLSRTLDGEADQPANSQPTRHNYHESDRCRSLHRVDALDDGMHTFLKLYEQQDMTVAQIGEVLGVSRTTVYRALRRETGATAPSRRRRASPKAAP